MEKFNKDKDKIKNLKVKRGIPLFINFCYNQGIRNELKNSKLFIENGNLHYHLKSETGFIDNDNGGARVKESVQYIVKNIFNYTINEKNIIIEGEIEKTKNGLNNKKNIVYKICLYRIYKDEEKLLEYLNNKRA